MQWHTHSILALGMQKLMVSEFQASQRYMTRPCLKTTMNTGKPVHEERPEHGLPQTWGHKRFSRRYVCVVRVASTLVTQVAEDMYVLGQGRTALWKRRAEPWICESFEAGSTVFLVF